MSKNCNLFVFVSNTYTGRKILNGITEERRKIIEVLGLNSLYDEIIKSKFEIIKVLGLNPMNSKFKITKLKDKIRFCFLNDCTEDELKRFLKVLKDNYNYFNIMLCLSGHGCNSSGLCLFLTQDNKKISLSDIISILNTNSLLTINVLLDMCRSGQIVNENFSTNFVNLITDKRVVVITPVRRGQKTQDTMNGGYLIQALVKTIRDKQDLFIEGLFSFQDTIRFVKYIVYNNIKIKLKKSNILFNVTFERFLNGIVKKNPIYESIQTEMCEKFPSIYISAKGISYLQRYPKQLEEYKNILDILKRRVSDLSLEDAVVRILPTVIREK